MNTTFILEEKDLLKTFLNQAIFNDENTFYKQMRLIDEKYSYDNKIYPKIQKIELIIRPDCNQSCEYCYIKQHGKELYPIEQRLTKNEILNNLNIFLDFIFNEKKYYVKQWELFAGDLFYDGIFFDILDIFDKYYKQYFQLYKSLFLKEQIIILLPVNTSFSKNKDTVLKLKQYIDYFKTEYNIRIVLSFSTDGKYAVDTREQDNLNINNIDEYYDNLFKLSKELNFCFHPMISHSNVKNWIKNYDWWIENFSKYYKETELEKDFQPMILEVRNNDWDDESLKEYEKLLTHIFNKRLQICNNNIDELAYHIFNGNGENNTLPKLKQYDLLHMGVNNSIKISCSIQGLLHINLADLSLVLCHRLTYHQFKGGKFIVENNKITDIEPINPTLFLNIFSINSNLLPKCYSCVYKYFCIKECLGSSYETHGELFFPSDNTCNFLQKKYEVLIKLYFNSGLFESALKQGILNEIEFEKYKKILDFLAV